MATLADSLVSSSARKMPIRKRPDLTAKRQRYLGRSYWVVKDPVGLNYFRFQDEEYAILQMIDGYSSLDEIKDRFEAEFPPQKITLEELQQFLGQLHRSGLIVAAVPGQGRQLRKRRDERRRKEILGAMTNILCIRFKGIDPERALNWLYPYTRWIFSPLVMMICLMTALSALTLILVEFDTFRNKLPGFYQFFSPTNALLLAVTLGASKVIHEFGHGLTCKHFGGECHEMGVMILVLTPCLYCNVSDSWMLPNKWHRAAIGAAGIIVEVTMAAICTFIWWFTEPGLLHYLCLNVMFISSVSTILFNANPLLRYDGYYIASDITEIPNLRQKATTILSRKMGLWFLGIEPPDDPFLPERNQAFFALYSVAAVVYRWFILASILMFLYKVFEPYGLKVVGQAIAAMAIYGLLFQPIYKLFQYFRVPGRWHKVKKPRLIISLSVLALLIWGFVWVPLPHHVMSILEVQARDADTVYVSVPGKLEETYVKPGSEVVCRAIVGKETSANEEDVLATINLDPDDSNAGYRLLTVSDRSGQPVGNGQFVGNGVRPGDTVRLFIDDDPESSRYAAFDVEEVIGESQLRLKTPLPVPVDEPKRIEIWHATPLARLSSIDLDLMVSDLVGKRDLYRKQVQNLEQRQRYDDPLANARIVELGEALRSVEQQLQEKARDRQRLNLRASRKGVVLPPTWVPKRKAPDGQLSSWSGTPLRPENLGCFMDQGVSFCLIGDPQKMEAILVVDQADVDFISVGQKVEIMLDQLTRQTFSGEIIEIAPDAMEVSPTRLSTKAGGDLSSTTDEAGVERPMSASYQARVFLDDPDGLFRIGLRGQAKIHVAPQTLGRRVWRVIVRTFNFKL